jgi:pimeloyl-ACP methyl ester carboxylesterase
MDSTTPVPSLRVAVVTGSVRDGRFGPRVAGWCWTHVADALRRPGHSVFTPTQTGLADLRHLMSRDITMVTFVLDVVHLIDRYELTDVVLVGHSFGGRTVTGVADRRPGALRHLCYLDAGIPVGGASRLESLPPQLRAARIAAAEAFDGASASRRRRRPGTASPIPSRSRGWTAG